MAVMHGACLQVANPLSHRMRFIRQYNDGPRTKEMTEHEFLAERFEQNRGHLRAVAYRMLGSSSEADDAVQEAWLRLSRSDAGGIENLAAWLTTVVARVCLDMLRARTSRREEELDTQITASPVSGEGWRD